MNQSTTNSSSHASQKTTLLDGRISLLTPEGVRILLTPASAAVRAWSWLIDFIIFLILVVALSFLINFFIGPSGFGKGIYLISLFVIYWGYGIISEVYFKGRTLGKRIVGLQVLRTDGLPVGWRESSLRNILLVADFLPFFYFAGLLSMLYHPHFRRIGDMVAGTVVVYEPKPSKREALRKVEPQAMPFPLTPEQQRCLINLFEREKHIPIERMQELAHIAEPLTGVKGQASLDKLRAYVASMNQ